MSQKQNKKITDLILKLEQDGVDVSKYKQELENINKDLKSKKFGLVWEEYTEPLLKELESKYVSLIKDKSKQIFKENQLTNNFLIEGDNLESLNALKNSRKKVEVIYIDPPYNTGNEFVYNDKIVNKEDSFKHSKWLSFMEKRLILARELLTDDGVIFISIDDNEQAHLKLLLDEIFGEENFINNFMWLHGKGKKTNQSRTLQQYTLAYAKKIELLSQWKEEKELDYKFLNPDNDPKGPWFSGSVSFNETRSNPKHKNYYEVVSPSGIIWKRQWMISKNEMQNKIEQGDIFFGNPPEYKQVPRLKKRPTEVNEVIPSNIISNKGTTKSSSNDLESILLKDAFSYPKPVELIKHFIKIINHPNKNATILDFFAGSGTTGHAVLELNKEDGGNRQFILCTNNENNICEDVTYQRLNKVINGYTTPKGKEVEGIPANLTYLKTELINKEDSDFIFYDKSHLEYIKNLLKLRYSISEDVDIEVDSEAILTILKGKDKDVYIYLNDYVDLEDFKDIELNKEKENLIYVDSSLVNDLNLTKKGFKEIKKVNYYFN